MSSSIFSSPLFASSPYSQEATSFHPLFRFLDDFEQHSRNTNNTSEGGHRQSRIAPLKTFTPKFDVKETADAYELHGDLPGIEQKDVEIEFTDSQTLSIKGRTEHSSTSSSGFVEDAPAQGSITDGKADTSSTHNGGHKATVEDEEAAAAAEKSNSSSNNKNNNNNNTSTEVATKGSQEVGRKGPATKYWVSERSVGEFSRSFSFPVRVDADAVKANMKNGVLSIVVPKARKQESRKITIG